MIVDNRCAIRIVIWSPCEETSRIVRVISSSVSESSDGCRLVKDQQCRLAQQGPGNRQPLLLPARQLQAAFPDHRIDTLFRPRQQVRTGRLSQRLCQILPHSRTGLTNNRFSRMVPANNWVSCVTNPICRRRSSKLIVFSSKPVIQDLPLLAADRALRSASSAWFYRSRTARRKRWSHPCPTSKLILSIARYCAVLMPEDNIPKD